MASSTGKETTPWVKKSALLSSTTRNSIHLPPELFVSLLDQCSQVACNHLCHQAGEGADPCNHAVQQVSGRTAVRSPAVPSRRGAAGRPGSAPARRRPSRRGRRRVLAQARHLPGAPPGRAPHPAAVGRAGRGGAVRAVPLRLLQLVREPRHLRPRHRPRPRRRRRGRRGREAGPPLLRRPAAAAHPRRPALPLHRRRARGGPQELRGINPGRRRAVAAQDPAPPPAGGHHGQAHQDGGGRGAVPPRSC
jgi:hypothetical protein